MNSLPKIFHRVQIISKLRWCRVPNRSYGNSLPVRNESGPIISRPQTAREKFLLGSQVAVSAAALIGLGYAWFQLAEMKEQNQVQKRQLEAAQEQNQVQKQQLDNAKKHLEMELEKSPEGRAMKVAQKMKNGIFSGGDSLKSSLLANAGLMKRPEVEGELLQKLSTGPPLVFTLIEAGSGTGKSTLVHEIAVKERAQGRTVVYVSLKDFQGKITLNNIFDEDWFAVRDALKSISDSNEASMAPLIIIDDIQKVFDKNDTDPDGFCSPLLGLHEKGIANVIFVSSDGSVYDRMNKFSGFARLVFYEWNRVTNDRMYKYVMGISTTEVVQMKNKHVNAQSARVFADNFDGWFTGLSLWINSGKPIEEFSQQKGSDIADNIKEAILDPEMRAALSALCKSKGKMSLSTHKKAFLELAKMKLVAIERKSVQFNYPFIKTIAAEILNV